jgi:hypothetical protein
LGNPAKAQASVIVQIRKPMSGNGVMDVLVVSQRNPNIYIREKE